MPLPFCCAACCWCWVRKGVWCISGATWLVYLTVSERMKQHSDAAAAAEWQLLCCEGGDDMDIRRRQHDAGDGVG